MSDFTPGTAVRHPLFGVGTVRAVLGSGPSAKITVDFNASVGQKKLLAGAANLQSLNPKSRDEDDDSPRPAPPAAPLRNVWVECLDAEGSPRSGRRPPREKLVQAIGEGVRQTEFWQTVRENLRRQGRAPRVLDDLDEKVSIVLDRLLRIQIRVEHTELLRPDDRVLARAAFDLIAERYLFDFDRFAFREEFSVQNTLHEEGLIRIGEAAPPENLPDRAPRQRPKAVTPKGVIKSRPKRRDDY